MQIGLGLAGAAMAKPWWPAGASYAADFVNNRYMIDGVAVSAAEAFTVSRATPKLAPDSDGTYLSFAADTPARTGRGLLLEPAATNMVRNNTMVGAVPGTPGSVPTDWFVPTTPNGLQRQVVGTGVDKGIAYMDLRYWGTTSSAGLVSPVYGQTAHFPVSPGQFWTNSVFLALVGGSTAGLTSLTLRMAQFAAGGVYLADFDDGSGGSIALNLMGLGGELTRFTTTGRAFHSSAVYGVPHWQFGYGNGVAIDFTLRVGLPQMESALRASSPIPTSDSAMSRAGDSARVYLPAGNSSATLHFNGAPDQIFPAVAGSFALPMPPAGAWLESVSGYR